MRIALANWTNRLVGGAETYLGTVAVSFAALGHDVALLAERNAPHDRDLIPLPDSVNSWTAETTDSSQLLHRLRSWRPDIILVNGLESHELGGFLSGVAPAVFLCHSYHGLCISGSKTHSYPRHVPCPHRFDARCLGRYYPRRCGGLNPATLFRDYRRQRQHLKLLADNHIVVTISRHMREEYVRQGIDPDRVFAVPPPVASRQVATAARRQRESVRPDVALTNLLFLGRMDRLKGGTVLLDAMPLVAANLDASMRLILAGDGAERVSWQDRAANIAERCHDVDIQFPGWVEKDRIDELLVSTDLLVLPSLWPEPFGLVGLEAGLVGVPTAAFAVGGISEWLSDGVNGHLAPNPPATPLGLANAITACVKDTQHFESLREGAIEVASAYTVERHLDALLDVFEKANEP